MQEDLNYEQVGDWQVYYSYADKPGKTFGMSNNRMLVFNLTNDELFYLNEKQTLPFGNPSKVPKSSKGAIKVSKSTINNPSKTNTLIFKSIEPDLKDKSKKIIIEWDFSFKTEQLMLKWYNLFDKHRVNLEKMAQDKQKTSSNQAMK